MATKSISAMYQPNMSSAASKPVSTALESLLTYAVPFGRALFAALFLMAGLGHFSAQEIGYAAHAGVPFANFLVPFSGVLALAGGLSLLLGYRARIGAALLFLFLVPVTFMMHRFWAETNPMMAQVQLAMFMKNVALIGTTLLIAYFGAGPVSLDSRREAKIEQAK